MVSFEVFAFVVANSMPWCVLHLPTFRTFAYTTEHLSSVGFIAQCKITAKLDSSFIVKLHKYCNTVQAISVPAFWHVDCIRNPIIL